MPAITIRQPRAKVMLSNDQHARIVLDEYKGLAEALGRKVGLQFGRDHKELADEALSKLGEFAMEAQATYDRSRGAQLGTWVYSTLYRHLYNICDRQKKRERKFEPSSALTLASSEPRAQSGWRDRLESLLFELSEEAGALVRIVVEAPGELSHVFRRAEEGKAIPIARAALLQYLQDAGVDDDVIDRAWTEVREALCA